MNVERGPVTAGLIGRADRQGGLRPHNLRIRFFAYLLVLDLLSITIAFAIAPLLHGSQYSNERLEFILAGLLPVYVITAMNGGAYSAELIRRHFRAVAVPLRSFVYAIGIIVLVAFSLKASESFSRLTLVLGALVSIAMLASVRYWFIPRAIRLIGGNPFRVVLLIDGEQKLPPGEFSSQVYTSGHFDPDSHDPGMYDRLAKTLDGADRVVVSCPADRRISWANALRGASMQAEIVVPELDQLTPLGISWHGERSSLIVSTGPLNFIDRAIKRAFDTALAAVALLFLSPVLLMTALLIKLDSPGPVFFRQMRIGRGNELFEVLKFRSMTVEGADSRGNRSTARGDDRITRFGSFIRRTSIDELPQLINVLRGDMSIVGPRPHAIGSRAADKLFWEIDSRYWIRHAAKPGLTGLAQVRGYRGATLEEGDLVNRLHSDLEYLDDWSIWRDLRIIVLTFKVLLHRNAF